MAKNDNLKDFLTDLAEGIKTVDGTTTINPQDMRGHIESWKEELVAENIKSGVEIFGVTGTYAGPTIDTNAAVAEDIIEGKNAYVNGELVIGTLPIYDYSDMDANIWDADSDYAYVESDVNEYSVIEDLVYSKIPLTEFGNVDKWHVAQGYTFTSAEGIQVEGEIPVYDYSPIAVVYQEELDEGAYSFMGSFGSGTLVEDEIYLKVPIHDFGDAYPSQVLEGRKFTSARGFCLSGTIKTKTVSDITSDNLTITIPKGYYADNVNKTLIDSNLIAENIKKDVTVFGVTGSYSGGGISPDTCTINIVIGVSNDYFDASGTALINGSMTYVGGAKTSGTITLNNVMCGSCVMITGSATYYYNIDYNGNWGQTGCGYYLTAPATSGTYTATISVYDD